MSRIISVLALLGGIILCTAVDSVKANRPIPSTCPQTKEEMSLVSTHNPADWMPDGLQRMTYKGTNIQFIVPDQTLVYTPARVYFPGENFNGTAIQEFACMPQDTRHVTSVPPVQYSYIWGLQGWSGPNTMGGHIWRYYSVSQGDVDIVVPARTIGQMASGKIVLPGYELDGHEGQYTYLTFAYS